MLHLALLWHQHQPVYKDPFCSASAGSHRQPWVRLHAIRDYYAMADLVAAYPAVHLTINLTPTLLWQIEDQVERGATDRARVLTATPAEDLSEEQTEELLATFFDAHWHNQIFPHLRYKELFARRRDRHPFALQDLRDLQMWFNLAWFGREFRDGEVALATGETTSVQRFVEQARDFGADDIAAMLAEQDKILRAVIPIHRQLQERGQIEVATTPYAHPILPLIIDTDQATIDRPDAAYPTRFSHPEDADAQVARAIELYRCHFDRRPTGMWPAEGAVSQSVVPVFRGQGIRWIATDRGVLARSGRWGYEVEQPDVLCQPYRAEEHDAAVSVFFRDPGLSDAIGFRYATYDEPDRAAAEFVADLKGRFGYGRAPGPDRVVTVVLDGENAWGAYRDDARPFLHALYRLLATDPDLITVGFAEYLDGNANRGVSPHPLEAQTKVYDLFAGSWIDEHGSAPGVDMGTWIGEAEENRAWDLLGRARRAFSAAGRAPMAAPDAFASLLFAEGSDWFWWFGDDQDAGRDDEFDDLFRTHLKHVYHGIGTAPPPELDLHIVSHAILWTFAQQTPSVQPGDRVRVRTNCRGLLSWQIGDGAPMTAELLPVGGAMAGTGRHQLVIGPFPEGTDRIRLRFRCTEPGCPGDEACCPPGEYAVAIAGHPAQR